MIFVFIYYFIQTDHKIHNNDIQYLVTIDTFRMLKYTNAM